MIAAGAAFLFYWFLFELHVEPIQGLLITGITFIVLGLILVGVPQLRR